MQCVECTAGLLWENRFQQTERAGRRAAVSTVQTTVPATPAGSEGGLLADVTLACEDEKPGVTTAGM